MRQIYKKERDGQCAARIKISLIWQIEQFMIVINLAAITEYI